MRWPFRRRDLPSPEPPRKAAPLTVTVWTRPPIMVSDTFGLPDVAGTRSLLPRHDRPSGPDAPRGRVVAMPVVARPGWLAALRHRLAGRAPVAPVAEQPWAVRVLERPAPPSPLLTVAEYHDVPPPPSWTEQPSRPGAPTPDEGGWVNDDAIAELRSILDIARDQPGPAGRPPSEPADSGVQPAPRRLSLAEGRRLGISRSRPPRPEPPAEPPNVPPYPVVEQAAPAEPPRPTAAPTEPPPTAAAAELPKRVGAAAEGSRSERPRRADIADEVEHQADGGADLSKPASAPAEPSRPVAELPKQLGVAAGMPRPRGVAEGQMPADIAAEGPKPVVIAAEGSAAEVSEQVDVADELPADMPGAVPIEVTEVAVDITVPPDVPPSPADVPAHVVVEKPAVPAPERIEPPAPPDPAPRSTTVPEPAPSVPEPSRRLGLGAPLRPGVRRVVDQVPTQWTERPPDDLMAMVGAAHGVDVSDTRVHRGAEVTALADAVGARAFTAAGAVFLPDTAGPLATVETRATLAHELTHVAQQRTLGTALPAEWTPAGQALESEAVLAQRWALAGSSGPPLRHPPVARALAATGSTSDGVQRQPFTEQSWTAPDEILAQLTSQTEAAPNPVPPNPGLANPMWPEPILSRPPAAAEELDPPPVQSWVVDQELLEHRDRLLALCAQRPVNLDNVLDMEELAVKLYHRLRGLLRGELIVDRERAGLLTDFR